MPTKRRGLYMHKGLIAFVVGLLCIRVFPASLESSHLLLTLLLIGFLVAKRWLVVASLFAGLAVAQWSLLSWQADRLEPRFDGARLWVTAQIEHAPQWHATTAALLVEGAYSRRTRLPEKIWLVWPEAPALKQGQQWRWLVSLRRQAGLTSFAGFDKARWLASQGVGAYAVVKQAQLLEDVPQASFRQRLREQLLALDVPNTDALLALTLADGSAMAAERWALLQQTGTVHLFVVSGSHIALLAAFAFGFVSVLRRIPWVPASEYWRDAAFCVSLLLATLYAWLAAWSLPVQRAWLMLLVFLLCRWGARALSPWLAWWLALLLVLLLQPMAPLQAGFWLSFVAVALLLAYAHGRLLRRSWWLELIALQWLIGWALLPWLNWHDLPGSGLGLLANLVAIPLLGFVVVPLALLGCLLLPVSSAAEVVLSLAGSLLTMCFAFFTWLVEHAGSWPLPMISGWQSALLLLASLLLLLPRIMPLYGLAVPLLVLGLLWPKERPPHGQAQITVLDVGQGLAVLVETAEQVLLYDTGSAWAGGSRAEQVVIPYLRQRGWPALDVLLISHADNDHAGGLQVLTQQIPTKVVIAGEALPDSSPCVAHQTWQWQGVSFRLWQAEGEEGNAASCVLHVRAADQSVLLTGDIGQGEEAALLREPWLSADWLIAPHHGSNSSSSARFIQTLKPAHAVFSRGAYNAFRHPHPAVSARYRAAASLIYDTGVDGSLRWRLGGDSPQPERAVARWGFWREK